MAPEIIYLFDRMGVPFARTKEERLNGLMGNDGITNCGNAHNCINVCPMSIPLTRAVYETNRDVTVDALFGWLRK